MKWLVTTFLSLLIITASAESIQAQDQPPLGSPPGTVVLPLVTLCSPLEPDLGLLDKFGETGFLEGDATIYIPGDKTVNGTITIYLTPTFPENTFTIIFSIGNELYCMISSGQNIEPVVGGDNI